MNKELSRKLYSAITGIGSAVITNGSDFLQEEFIEKNLEMPLWLRSGGDFFNPIAHSSLFNLGIDFFLPKLKPFKRYTPIISTINYEVYEIASNYLPIGTFDPNDMIAYALGGTLAYLGNSFFTDKSSLKEIKGSLD